MRESQEPPDTVNASRGPDPQGSPASVVEPELRIETLVRDHYQAVYRYAFRLAGRVADAEDLCQQTFLAAQQHLHQVRDTRKLDRWLFAVLRNCFLKSCGKRVPLPASRLELEVETVAQPAARVALEDVEALQAALQQLPEEFRVVVLMFYFEQRSYLEIAEELQVSPGTVMSRLSRAKQKLRRLLGDSDAEWKGTQPAPPAPPQPATSTVTTGCGASPPSTYPPSNRPRTAK